MIVLDCSFTMALVMPDETRPDSVERVLAARLLAPSIWPFELANALCSVVRRRRLSDDDVPAICAQIEIYEIEVFGDGGPYGPNGFRQRYLAARNHDLGAYDAAYLELALQRRCALATLDGRLADAARQAGVAVLN